VPSAHRKTNPDTAPASAPPASPAGPAAAAPAEGGRLLVVDDTEHNRDLLARRLRRAGFDVETAEDGVSALSLLEASHPAFDVVLLDVMMPGVSGLDVLKAIRRTHAATELPVIMATAKDESADIVEAFELGANDYVTKPLDLAVVLARLRTQLSLKRSVERNLELEHHLARRAEELEQANQRLGEVNARMKSDLDAAAVVQKSLLPSALPTVPGATFEWVFRPSAELAGDILNVLRLDDRHVGMYVLDVSGHGVAAALLSVTMSRFLSALPDPTSPLWRQVEGEPCCRLAGPGEVMDRLGARFPLDAATPQFATAVYGLLDTETGEFRYASAGHPGLIHVPRDDEPRVYTEASFPIGIVVSDDPYDEHTLHLAPGDRVFLYSDGVTEAMDPAGTLFGEDRLIAAITQCRTLPLDATLAEIFSAVERWVGHDAFKDDVSLLALEVAGGEPE